MKVNYEKVYQVISTYYPIGIPFSDDRYKNYPGVVLANELKKKADPDPWRKLVEKIAGQNTIVARGLDGFAFLGSLLLLEKKMGEAVYKRQVYFHLSLLDPLYTVYGIDTISVKSGNERSIHFDPVVIISPLDIYEKWFQVIRQEIEREYPNAAFVPFSIFSLKVRSVNVPGALVRYAEDPTVFQALFHGVDITNYKYLGDIRYE